MARAGDRQQPLGAGAGGVVFPAHGTGHEVVGLPVDEQDGDVRVGHRTAAVGVLGVKAAEHQRPQPPDGVHRPHRQAGQVLRQAAAGDLPRAGVAAVRNDAPHAARQVQRTGHQHGGSPHRNAHQEQRRLRPEAPCRPPGPGPAVVALLHAHGDGVPAAGPVAALVGQQHVEAQALAQGIAAQAVPAGKPLVPVEDDGQRRAVGVVVIPSGQPHAVVRRDVDRLAGGGRQGGGVPFHLRAVGQRADQFFGGQHLGLRRMVEPQPVHAVGRPQQGRPRRSRPRRPRGQKMGSFHRHTSQKTYKCQILPLL